MQLSLVYDAASVGGGDWDAELGWFSRAVDVVGHKEVAYKLDVQPSNLTDAIRERERKDVKGRWISVVRRMVTEDMRAEYLRIVCSALGYETPKQIRPMDADEENRIIRDFLQRRAPAVLDELKKEIGR